MFENSGKILQEFVVRQSDNCVIINSMENVVTTEINKNSFIKTAASSDGNMFMESTDGKEK